MAIDEDTAKQGLSALSVAAAELIEGLHDDLVSALPDTSEALFRRFGKLTGLGEDLLVLAAAAQLLIALNRCD